MISAAMSAADALPINMRIAIADESIFQIEGLFYTQRQEDGYHPTVNKLEHYASTSEANGGPIEWANRLSQTLVGFHQSHPSGWPSLD